MKPTAEQSAQALKEFKEKLDSLNIPFCLFLGTALGAYRDKTYCPGDEDDMDVAVDIKYYDRIEEIKEEFNKDLNWQIGRQYHADDGIAPESCFSKIYSLDDPGYYSKVDIFFISDLDGKKCWRFHLDDSGNKNITKLFDKKHFENWDKIEFFGTEYNIPSFIEEYLECNYGDWRTPIHRDNWDWRTDNKAAEKDLVSIIIPVWGNYDTYLNECIDSINNQTYINYEIIIVDNKTDLPSARNEGIKKAKGYWILCLDVDDKIFPTFLEKTIGLNDIVSTAHQDQYGNNNHIEPIDSDKFKIGNQIISGSLFKREVWVAIGGYDENMKDGYEDWDFWWRATKKGYKISVVNELLYMYRKHENSMITKTVLKDEEIRKYVLNKNL